MSSKKVFVSLENKKVKVNCSTYSSVFNETKSKLNISSDAFRLEYFDDEANDWITLCNDEDLEDVSTSTKIRVVLEEKSSKPKQGSVKDEAPKSDSEAFRTTPSHSNHTGGGAKINVKIRGGLLEGKHAHFGLGDNVAGTSKNIETFTKAEGKKYDSSNPVINVEINDNAHIKTEKVHMGMGNIYDILKDVDPEDFYFPDYDGEKFDIEPLLKKAKRVSKKEHKKQINNSERYPVQKWGQSQALIFNFMFSNTSHYREGANRDTKYLNKLLIFLGFQVQSVDSDQTEENINKKIKEFLNSKKVALAPMVLLFIGSHGKQVNGTDHFRDANMKPVSVASIVDMFKTNKDFTALQGKPKLFWFQFCREISEERVKADGIEESFMDWYKSQIPCSDGMEDDLSEKLSDMFLAYATLPSLKAYRDPGDGSWFVKSICKVFIENSFKDEYKKMFEEVNKAVKEKNYEKYIQMCDLKNGLKKSLYFYPQ